MSLSCLHHQHGRIVCRARCQRGSQSAGCTHCRESIRRLPSMPPSPTLSVSAPCCALFYRGLPLSNSSDDAPSLRTACFTYVWSLHRRPCLTTLLHTLRRQGQPAEPAAPAEPPSLGQKVHQRRLRRLPQRRQVVSHQHVAHQEGRRPYTHAALQTCSSCGLSRFLVRSRRCSPSLSAWSPLIPSANAQVWHSLLPQVDWLNHVQRMLTGKSEVRCKLARLWARSEALSDAGLQRSARAG